MSSCVHILGSEISFQQSGSETDDPYTLVISFLIMIPYINYENISPISLSKCINIAPFETYVIRVIIPDGHCKKHGNKTMSIQSNWYHTSLVASEMIRSSTVCPTACSRQHKRIHQQSALLDLCEWTPPLQRACNADLIILEATWYHLFFFTQSQKPFEYFWQLDLWLPVSGVSSWGSVNSDCSGSSQSPIDITDDNTELNETLYNATFNFGSYSSTSDTWTAINYGKTGKLSLVILQHVALCDISQ